jgi:hypothetical protein
MRALRALIVLYTVVSGAAQPAVSDDDALLTRSRALYDAPFTRGLISFDCELNFDWRQHFVDVLGSLPAAATPTIERLQQVHHRVIVDRSGAVVSAIPKAPALTAFAHAADLEQTFTTVASSGLNAWLPSSTNVLLPVGSTKSSWEKTDVGYKLTMKGPGLDAQLLLTDDLRLTGGVTELPQSMRFTTVFTPGPDGFLLSSVTTGDTTDPSASKEATFAYTYQTLEGFQIPFHVTVTSASSVTWHYALADCKAVKGVIIESGPSRH